MDTNYPYCSNTQSFRPMKFHGKNGCTANDTFLLWAFYAFNWWIVLRFMIFNAQLMNHEKHFFLYLGVFYGFLWRNVIAALTIMNAEFKPHWNDKRKIIYQKQIIEHTKKIGEITASENWMDLKLSLKIGWQFEGEILFSQVTNFTQFWIKESNSKKYHQNFRS